jgi:hypothetical protein
MNETPNSVAYWRGKRLEECTHTELMEAVNFLAAELETYRGQSEALAIGKVELLKRRPR